MTSSRNYALVYTHHTVVWEWAEKPCGHTDPPFQGAWRAKEANLQSRNDY